MKKILVLIFVILLGAACPFGKKKADSDSTIFAGAAPSRTAAVTVEGVQVKKAAGSVTPSILTSIDSGLTKAFRIASSPPNNYTAFARHGSYIVGLWPRSPKCINPGFLIRADGSPLYPDGWDQHPTFDKDPAVGKVLLCIAGINHYTHGQGGQSTGRYGMLVVDDAGIMENIVWFESEHLILFQADPNRWVATVGVHAHPLLGEGDGLTTEDGGFTAWMYELPEDVDLGDGIAANKGDRACLLITK